MAERRESVRIRNFLGGFNTRDDPADIADNALASGSTNIRITGSRASYRTGFQQITTAPGPPASLTSFYGGVNDGLVTDADGDIYTFNGSALTSQATTTLNDVLVDWVSMNDLDIAFHGGTPQRWNGTTVAALGGSPPAATMAEVFRNHIMVAGHSGAELRFSDQEDPETWPAGNTIQVDIGAGSIQGLKKVNDRLVIFKFNGIDHLVGSDILTFSRIPVIRGIGCVSNQSIVWVNNSPNPQWNGLYWVDHRGIYFSPDLGATSIRISDPIQPTFDDDLDAADLNNCFAANLSKQDMVCFWFMNSTDTNGRASLTLTWNYKYGIWNPIWNDELTTHRAAGEIQFNGEIRLFVGLSNVGIVGEFPGDQSANANVTFNLVTKQFDFGQYEQNKTLRKLHYLASGGNAGTETLTTRAFYNQADATNNANANKTGSAQSLSSSINSVEEWYNETVRSVQFKLTGNIDFDAPTKRLPEVRDISLEYLEKEQD